VNAGLATGNDVVRARIGLGGERTDGFSAANPATAPTANPDDDGNRRHHATLAVDATAAAGHRVSLDLRRVDGKVEYDSTESFSTPTDTHAQHLEQTGASLNGEHALRGDWTLAWRWAESREKRKDNGESAFGPFEFDNSVRNRVLSVELNGSPLAGWRTQVGVERLAQKTDIPSYTRQTRDTEVVRLGAFHEASWGSLQANLRHDKTSDFGDATTGLLGGKLKLAQGLSAFASASTGFTPPTLDFLFFDCAPFVCSNPDLRPEESRNAELALQWQDARTLARATAFAARYRDKIANDENFVPRNLNRVKNQGLELSVRHAVADWTFLGEAAFQNPVDETTGERLIRRAKQQFSLRADYQQPRWHAGAGVRYVGARRDNGDLEAGAYTVVDLSGHLTLAPQWTLQATVDNLFDRHYEPTIGYNGRPRWLFVGVSWTPRE